MHTLLLAILPLGARSKAAASEACRSHLQVAAVKGPAVVRHGSFNHGLTADDFIAAARRFQDDVRGPSLVQGSAAEALPEESLAGAEAAFAHGQGEAAHGDVGGDRMQRQRHNYAPTYSKYITAMERQQVPVPAVVEVGILTGSGLAMWQTLFPKSHIYGFDIDTTAYKSNLPRLVSLGMQADRVAVSEMDQEADNTAMLKTIFGSTVRPAIIVDDGYHSGNAGKVTFSSLKPFLADRFVYFIEDILHEKIDGTEWKETKDAIMEECVGCHFSFECPTQIGSKDECMAVITNIQV